jgi:hypothetical protein
MTNITNISKNKKFKKALDSRNVFVDVMDYFHKNYETLFHTKTPKEWYPILFYGNLVDDLVLFPELPSSSKETGKEWSTKKEKDPNKEMMNLIRLVYKRYYEGKSPFEQFYVRESYTSNQEVINIFTIKTKTYKRYLITDIEKYLEAAAIELDGELGNYMNIEYIFGKEEYKDNYFNNLQHYVRDITNLDYTMKSYVKTVIDTYEYEKHNPIVEFATA